MAFKIVVSCKLERLLGCMRFLARNSRDAICPCAAVVETALSIFPWNNIYYLYIQSMIAYRLPLLSSKLYPMPCLSLKEVLLSPETILPY